METPPPPASPRGLRAKSGPERQGRAGPSRSRRYLGPGDLTSELPVRGAHDPGLATLSRLRMPSWPRVAVVPWWELSEPAGVLGGR